MITLMAKNIVHFFISQNVVKNEDEEVYQYGTELVVSTSLSFLATVVVTLVIGKLYYLLLFYLFFVPLRANVGGYHAPTYEQCFGVTVSTFLIYTLLVRYLPSFSTIYVAGGVIIASLYTVYKYAPLIHENNVIDENGIIKRKRASRLFTLINCVVIILMLVLRIDGEIVRAVSLSIGAVTISMIVQIFIEWRNAK